MNRMSSDHTCSQELIVKAQRGDAEAIKAQQRIHQGLIRSIAGRISREQISYEELMQAGNLGLLHALGRYDASLGIKLVTYAVPWILGEMRRAIRLAESQTYSLDRPLDDDGLSLHDVLAGSEDMNISYIDLHLAISRLSKEEQILLRLRYYRDQTQKESAMLLGKSQAQISRIESRALDALHAMLT